MKDNVLFAYHDEAVISEFCEMMQQFDFSIDTADNGLDAVEMLKKQEYKVVITGINLIFFDGLKIIEYLNRCHPNTVCMVYTSRMDLARLKFLVNHRNVFRIFLWPANYHGDFYQAILEGFVYYNLQCAQQEEQSRNEKKHAEYRQAVDELKKLTGHKRGNARVMGLFLLPIVRMSVNRFSGQLDQAQREKVVKYEENILSYYQREGYLPCDNLDEVKAFLEEEFAGREEEQELVFHLNQSREPLEPIFCEDVRFLSWLIINRFMAFTKTFMSILQVSFPKTGKAELMISLTLPKGTMEHHNTQPLSVTLTDLTLKIAEGIAENVDMSVEQDKIVYRFKLTLHKKLTFMEDELKIMDM